MKVFFAFLFTCLLMVAPCEAEGQQDQKSKVEAAWQAAMKASVPGPADLPLADQAVLHLPSDMFFVPKAESDVLMQAWGNSSDPSRQGLIMSKLDGQNWTISVKHTAEGYVKDDDAKTWNADELYASIKEGNEEQNKVRTEMGMPALDLVGWIQPPKYNSEKHHLVWSLKGIDRGAAAGEPATVNFNTYALGRDGYFEVNLMTSDKTIATDKAAAQTVLSAVEYNQGKRYSDFVEGTDHIAEYGLGALVAGFAAKKLGLLAVAGVFLAKFAKIIIAAVAVAGGSVFKIFRRNKTDGS